jgi:hypothetical protein
MGCPGSKGTPHVDHPPGSQPQRPFSCLDRSSLPWAAWPRLNGMGQEIVYCSSCGERILESEFEKGKAVTILKKNYCRNCAKDVVREPQTREEAPQRAPPSSSFRLRETRRIPLAEKPGPASRFPIPVPFLIAIGLGILVLVLLYIVLSRHGR